MPSRDDERQVVPPAGFTVVPSEGGGFVIHHRQSGMGCMNIFLLVWLAGWTVGCVDLLRAYLRSEKMDNGGPIQLWFVLVFWTAEVGVACLLAYVLFCRKYFRLDAASLQVETEVLGFKRSRTISKESIKRFIQVKDGGEGDDSFPSWGLQVEAEKKLTLLFRQPHEKSHWLGRALATWAQVEFIEAPKP